MEAETSRFVRYWWVVALAALAAGAITTSVADGFPILELEFAWTAERADEVLAGADLDAVNATILWDFVFLVCTPQHCFSDHCGRARYLPVTG